MSAHYIDRCECGIVVAQCRCPGPKSEVTVRPCRHPQPLTSEETAGLFEPSVSQKAAETAAMTANLFERRP